MAQTKTKTNPEHSTRTRAPSVMHQHHPQRVTHVRAVADPCSPMPHCKHCIHCIYPFFPVCLLARTSARSNGVVATERMRSACRAVRGARGKSIVAAGTYDMPGLVCVCVCTMHAYYCARARASNAADLNSNSVRVRLIGFRVATLYYRLFRDRACRVR